LLLLILLCLLVLPFLLSCLFNLSSAMLKHNVLKLPEGGDFEALLCQPSTNFD
jgi:hypothetical protein